MSSKEFKADKYVRILEKIKKAVKMNLFQKDMEKRRDLIDAISENLTMIIMKIKMNFS